MNYKMIDNKTEQESEKHDNLDLILKIKKLEKDFFIFLDLEFLKSIS